VKHSEYTQREILSLFNYCKSVCIIL